MKRWFIVTSYSGFENKVKEDLEKRRETLNMQDKIYQVLVPEVEIEKTLKNGKKSVKKEKLYPGYVFVEMEIEDEMDSDVWFNVRNTPNVTGFLGSSGKGTKPIPVPKDEMDGILQRLGIIVKPTIDLKVGDKVEIINGSMAGQVGEVAAINFEKENAVILIEFFGRSTPYNLEFKEFKKL